jgi:hypothetical protein
MIKSSSLLLLFFALSCSSPNAPDSILLNGKVWTGISDTDFQEAIAIKGNQIISVGKSSDLKKTVDSKIAGINNSTTYDGFGELVKDKNGELTGVLCTMPRDRFCASNIGTFTCRTNPRDTKASQRANHFD